MGGTVSNISPIAVFIAAFFASAASGVAAYLRSTKPITWLALFTAGLNSGLLGLAIALLGYPKFQNNIYSLLGICVVTGLTGAAGLDLILTAIQKGGFQVKFNEEKNTIGIDMGTKKNDEN